MEKKIIPFLAYGSFAVFLAVLFRFVAFLYFVPANVAREVGWSRIAGLSLWSMNEVTGFVLVSVVQYSVVLSTIAVLVTAVFAFLLAHYQHSKLLVVSIILSAAIVYGAETFISPRFAPPLIGVTK